MKSSKNFFFQVVTVCNLVYNININYSIPVVFIKKTHRDTASVAFDIRTICMDDFPSITNTDEYIGFLYGMYSSNHDIECIFIDGILKHADISIENIPGFIDRLKKLSEECGINFYVSISAEKAELKDIDLDGCTLLN